MKTTSNNEVICLNSQAFYVLLDEVLNHIKEKYPEAKESLWVGKEEAMQLLGIKSPTTLLMLRSTGAIRYSQTGKKVILYERQSLLEHIEKHSRNTF